MTFMSRTEYAASRGWSRQYVGKLAKQGRLVTSPDGKSVDVGATDALLASSSDPSKVGVAERHHQDRLDKNVYAHIDPAALHVSPSLPSTPPLMSPPEVWPDYQKARARRENAMALLTEDEHRKRRGELVEQALVDSAAFTAARTLRDLMLGIPPKIAGELVTLTDPWEIERRLVQAIRRALEDADRQLSCSPASDEPD